jgi:hypothetical protein
MKAVGFAYGKLYGCAYGPFRIVVCAPDRKTAVETFRLWLAAPPRNVDLDSIQTIPAHQVKPAKTLGGRPLLWAQVDVTTS